MIATDKMASEINGIGAPLSSDSIKTLSKKISNSFHITSAKDTFCTISARQKWIAKLSVVPAQHGNDTTYLRRGTKAS